MSNYVTIEYPEVNLIMDLSDNCSLYPLTVINKINAMPLSYSGYSRGFCEIDNAVSVIIDFATFLKITPLKTHKEAVLLRMTGFGSDFSLIIPTPKFVKIAIDFKNLDLENKSKQDNYPLVSSDYCIIDDKIYLRIDGAQISRLLSDEISKFLTAQWSKSVPDWSHLPEDNLGTVLTRSILSKKSQISTSFGKKIDHKNTIILKIDKYNFSFPESLLSELSIFNHNFTKIPDSPTWVLGAYNYNNLSLPLVDLATLFGLEKPTKQTQLIAIINISTNDKLGLLCDSLDNVQLQPKDLTQLIPAKKSIKSPFNSISDHNNKFIFSLNLDFLKNSVSNASTIEVQNDWVNWRGFFTPETNKIIHGIKSKTKPIEQNKLIEYVEINYERINILLELSKETSIFPDQETNRIDQYPYYCEGLLNLGSSNCLIIDLSIFLGISDRSNHENVLITFEDGNNSNIALRIPKPNLVKFDIMSKSSYIIKDDNNISTKIPSSKYLLLDDLVYLMIDQTKLFTFLRNELKNKLSKTWYKSQPTFTNIPSNQLPGIKEVKSQIARYSSQVSSTNINQDNLLICRVDNSYFGIKESYVVHLISKEFKPTKIPDSPIWVEGLIEYQNEDIALVDLAALFQMAKDNRSISIIIIVSYVDKKIALMCDSIYLTTGIEKISIKPEDIETYDLPYSNIMDIDGKILFILNLEFIMRSTMLNDKLIKPTEWEKLLSTDTVNFHNNKIITDQRKVFENKYIHAKIHQSNYSIHLDQIISIQSVLNKERTKFKNVNLVAYEGQWVPSFQIDLEYSDRDVSTYDISLILKIKNIIFELQVDKLKFINQGDQLIVKSTWQTLLKDCNPIGLKPPVETDAGLAFGIDLESFVSTSIRSLIKKNINPDEFISSINIKPPLENKEDVISREMAQIWEDDLELYLIIIIETDNEDNKFALQIDHISTITLDPPKGVEFVKWDYGYAKSIFYVILTKVGENKKALKIPANCYLLGIKRDNIKRENSGTFLIDENEKIPLLNISNYQIGEI